MSITTRTRKVICVASVAAALTLGLGLTACGGQGQENATGKTDSTSQTSTKAAEGTSSSSSSKGDTQGDKSSVAGNGTSNSSSSSSTESSSASTSGQTTSTQATETGSGTSLQDGYIGEEKAKQIALADAGLTAADCTELKCELDLDDANVHYDVDFKSGGKEYDYDIYATTGAILEHKSKVDD